MPRCSFCGEMLKPGTGKIYVKSEGKVLYFCSCKCEKHMLKLKRKSLKTKWTKHFVRKK